ncbi:MAG: helix-turn-helix domain-containing protein [Deltaproteobacteria bacterium]|nr:helix-turn-helix domain-containing protein [Deltaproteobacteria bacterium]
MAPQQSWVPGGCIHQNTGLTLRHEKVDVGSAPERTRFLRSPEPASRGEKSKQYQIDPEPSHLTPSQPGSRARDHDQVQERRSHRAPNRTPAARKRLRRFINHAKQCSDLAAWLRGRAVGYIQGERVVELAEKIEVARGSINRWLRSYETMGVEGLVTGKAPGAAARLTDEQREELGQLVEAGSLEAGYTSAVWTGPMIADLILLIDNARAMTR